MLVREVVKTTTFEQDPPNHKIVGGVSTSPQVAQDDMDDVVEEVE